MRALSGEGPAHRDAVIQLHTLLIRAARKEAYRRSGHLGIAGSEVDDLAHQAAADALVARLETNRNAIYKTLFDARRKLRAFLIAHGHLKQDREQQS